MNKVNGNDHNHQYITPPPGSKSMTLDHRNSGDSSVLATPETPHVYLFSPSMVGQTPEDAQMPLETVLKDKDAEISSLRHKIQCMELYQSDLMEELRTYQEENESLMKRLNDYNNNVHRQKGEGEGSINPFADTFMSSSSPGQLNYSADVSGFDLKISDLSDELSRSRASVSNLEDQNYELVKQKDEHLHKLQQKDSLLKELKEAYQTSQKDLYESEACNQKLLADLKDKEEIIESLQSHCNELKEIMDQRPNSRKFPTPTMIKYFHPCKSSNSSFNNTSSSSILVDEDPISSLEQMEPLDLGMEVVDLQLQEARSEIDNVRGELETCQDSLETECYTHAETRIALKNSEELVKDLENQIVGIRNEYKVLKVQLEEASKKVLSLEAINWELDGEKKELNYSIKVLMQELLLDKEELLELKSKINGGNGTIENIENAVMSKAQESCATPENEIKLDLPQVDALCLVDTDSDCNECGQPELIDPQTVELGLLDVPDEFSSPQQEKVLGKKTTKKTVTFSPHVIDLEAEATQNTGFKRTESQGTQVELSEYVSESQLQFEVEFAIVQQQYQDLHYNFEEKLLTLEVAQATIRHLETVIDELREQQLLGLFQRKRQKLDGRKSVADASTMTVLTGYELSSAETNLKVKVNRLMFQVKCKDETITNLNRENKRLEENFASLEKKNKTSEAKREKLQAKLDSYKRDVNSIVRQEGEKSARLKKSLGEAQERVKHLETENVSMKKDIGQLRRDNRQANLIISSFKEKEKHNKSPESPASVVSERKRSIKSISSPTRSLRSPSRKIIDSPPPPRRILSANSQTFSAASTTRFDEDFFCNNNLSGRRKSRLGRLDEEDRNLDEHRRSELYRRNSMVLPHMKSCYPMEYIVLPELEPDVLFSQPIPKAGLAKKVSSGSDASILISGRTTSSCAQTTLKRPLSSAR